jgi:hypothetical protein
MFNYLFAAAVVSVALSSTACKQREFNGGSDIKSDARTPENFLPFNALKMLEDPKTEPITSYPKNYEKLGFNIVKPDGNGLIPVASDLVFYSAIKDWFGSKTVDADIRPNGQPGTVVVGGTKVVDYQLVATPTSYATVKGDNEDDPASGGVLTYVFEGRTLAIKVSELQENELNHADAAEACAQKQLRLPTARELFDFCFAGRTKLDKPNPMNPLNSRCSFRYNWTVTVKADNRQNAWAVGNWVSWSDRQNKEPFRCVGKAK